MTDITERLSTAIADRYRIQSHLGQGGMATVYLAEDLKHDRKVALKVLLPELAAVIGAERFLQEIKVTANLQHPHILQLYDSGEADSFLFYVMPYVDGESLRDKLDREKQLAVDEAISITTSIAGALDYAHRQDVIHRDIKPENILLHDGQAMVADFGIALAVSEAGSTRLTETGLSIGTPQYMSPEQAMGDRQLDARSDVYSLSAMLYEMLTGDPPYTGSTAQAIVAKVITEKAPPVTTVRDTVPPHVAAAIQQALNKLPADRFSSAAGFADALTRPTSGPVTAAAEAQAAPELPRVFSARQFGMVAGVAVLALGGLLWTWLKPAPTPEMSRFAVTIPDDQAMNVNHGGTTVVLSPDGRRFVYTGPDQQLYVREMDQLIARPLASTENARAPFFSPDGKWIGFHAEGAIRKVSLAGGPPLTITTASSSFRGASWGDNDLVVFTPSTSDPLYSVSAAGGEPVQVTTIDSATGEISHRWPVVLPGSKAVVFTIFDGSSAAEAELAVVSLETGITTRLRLKGMHPQYAPSGHLVYGTNDAALIATRISITAEFSISPSGELAYLTGLPPEFSLVLVDPDGAELKIIEDVQDLRGPRFSTDGNRIAMELSEGGVLDVWVYDLREETLTRMTFDGANYPEWTPDDKYVSFSSTGSEGSNLDIYRTASDGSGVAELVYGAPEIQWEGVWMPDGQSMVVREIGTGSSGDIILVGIDPPEDPVPLVNTNFDERSPKPSPDGRWLAYRSDESGRNEVFVRPIPGPGGKRQVSDNGGTEPLWSHDGSEIFYRGADGNFYSVAMRTSPTLSVGRRTILFEDSFVPNSAHANYDQHPTTGQFVMVKGTATKSDLVIVLNWREELKARME